jgi:hypothetical protein
MAVSFQVTERGLEIRGKALFVIYDVPSELDGDRGRHPARFRYLLDKILDTGKVRRVQWSVLAVEDRALLEPLINLILRYGGSALVVEGTYTHILPEER